MRCNGEGVEQIRGLRKSLLWRKLLFTLCSKQQGESR